MDPVNLATSELWAVMLEKQTEAYSGSLPLTLRRAGCGRKLTHHSHLPTSIPMEHHSCPICLGAWGPERPAYPPYLPARPASAWGRLPEENNVHCDQRHQVSWSWGIRIGPQGSCRPVRSRAGLGTAAWSWLRGRCHLVAGQRGHSQWPWEETLLVAWQPLPRPATPSGLGGPAQPCIGSGESQRGPQSPLEGGGSCGSPGGGRDWI